MKRRHKAPTPLMKSRTVFLRQGTGFQPDGSESKFIDFATEDEDCFDYEVDWRIAIRRVDWEDFGRPDHITVSIRPGDRLNP